MAAHRGIAWADWARLGRSLYAAAVLANTEQQNPYLFEIVQRTHRAEGKR